ncbi:hypothetical protein V1224_08820 [Lachnospiraceae bacterium JLR.KK008]
MKFIGRVSLFFIIGLVGFAAGIYANSAYLHWFYPNTGQEREFQLYTAETEAGDMQQESLPTDSRSVDVITCDTILSIEELDKNTDYTTEHVEEIPGKYIGMDREGFVDAMTSYELSPPLEEQQRGLISVEVLSFSGERVLIRKSYQAIEEPEEEIFYLVAENHYITVYQEDMNNVYLYTDIRVESLPEVLQEEIIQKKLISGQGALYHFLESYSS